MTNQPTSPPESESIESLKIGEVTYYHVPSKQGWWDEDEHAFAPWVGAILSYCAALLKRVEELKADNREFLREKIDEREGLEARVEEQRTELDLLQEDMLACHEKLQKAETRVESLERVREAGKTLLGCAKQHYLISGRPDYELLEKVAGKFISEDRRHAREHPEGEPKPR